MKNRSYYQYNLKCPNCGGMSTIQREIRISHERDHVKNLYCPQCKTTQKFTQIQNYEEYQYAEKTKSDKLLHIFTVPNRINLGIFMNDNVFVKWSKMNEDLIKRAITVNSDYNLAEILLLNYITDNNNIRSSIIEYPYTIYKNAYEPVVIKFSIKNSIYWTFLDICREDKLDPVQEIQNLINYSVATSPSFSFESLSKVKGNLINIEEEK